MSEEIVLDHHDQIMERRKKLDAMRERGGAYSNDFRRDSLAENLHASFNEFDAEQLEKKAHRVTVAGRMMTRRLMGKASFVNLQDMTGQIQLYIRSQALPEEVYAEFKHWDLGDIIAAEGVMFKTKTGELSIKVDQLRLLTKALRPLPDKYHGLSDKEMCYRQRYLDLIMNEPSRKLFYMRSRLVSAIRKFLEERHFLEVETPMMQRLPGGAVAKPFVTHHNALDMQLFLRVAPELFLKRLVVGGVERVFEVNRNFRNEGISTRHNPEFTMLEFYQAYADHNDLMDLTEEMMRYLADEILGSRQHTLQGDAIDFSKPFNRITLKDSIANALPDINPDDLDDFDKVKAIAEEKGANILSHYGVGKIQFELFEKVVERNLKAPTFITAYPTEVSPLARQNDENPDITDRFEFFVGGQEIANGFSELNDPDEQARRFKKQAEERAAGDDEAMVYDEDYIMALEYGMPPTAGEGIGIDRLAMLFTDSASIRDVILFPLMRFTDKGSNG